MLRYRKGNQQRKYLNFCILIFVQTILKDVNFKQSLCWWSFLHLLTIDCKKYLYICSDQKGGKRIQSVFESVIKCMARIALDRTNSHHVIVLCARTRAFTINFSPLKLTQIEIYHTGSIHIEYFLSMPLCTIA